jgi:acylphosphatase
MSSADTIERLRFTITGAVHGAGFRHFVHRLAAGRAISPGDRG